MADRFSWGARMPKHWHGIAGSLADLTAAGTSIGGLLAADGTPFTVIRMIGEFLISPTNGGAFTAGDAVLITLGLGVVSTDAVAAGAGSMPDPGAEPEFLWLYWTEVPVFIFDGTVAESESMATRRVTFDVRSRRKLKPRESLVCVLEYTDLSGAPPITVIVAGTRVLVAE